MVSDRRLLPSALVAAMTFAATAAHAEPPTASSDSPAEQASTGSQMRTAGWITAGGGVAALSAGLVMFRLAHVKNEDAVHSQEGLDEKSRDATRYHTAGQILLFTGVAGIATGASLVIFAPKDKVAPRVSVGLGQIAFRGNF